MLEFHSLTTAVHPFISTIHTHTPSAPSTPQVCRGLAALESCHPPVLHRDVKPSNIFIDAAGVARLGDFGLARAQPDNCATLTGETGTYLYMSPEMIR